MGAVFTIADWRIEPATGLVVGSGGQHRLEPKAMAVLVYLAEHAGEVVTRAQLEQHVWRDSVVTYEALTVTINKIRAALGDNSREPLYIETLAKRGYRLIAPVAQDAVAVADLDTTVKPATTRPPRTRLAILAISLAVLVVLAANHWQQAVSLEQVDDTHPLLADNIPSIAVLPFTNLSGDPAQDYFARGMTEQLITDLSHIPNLMVTSRNSVFGLDSESADLKEVGNILKVQYVLTGSVLRDGEQVRVNVQLNDLAGGTQLWADRVDGSTRDLFAMQDEISSRIIARVMNRVDVAQQETISRNYNPDPKAYDYFMRGNALYTSITKEGNELAREMYQKAVTEDPGFAGAYAAMALTYLDDYRRRWRDNPRDAVDQAFNYAEKAIAIDDKVAMAHVVKAYVYLYGRKQPKKAIEATRQALRLFPNYADAYAITGSAYSFLGRSTDAIRVNRQAMRLNPNSSFLYYANLGRDYYFLREPDKSIDNLRNAVFKNENYLNAHLYLAAVYASIGRVEEADWEKEWVLVLDPDFSLNYWASTQPYADKRRLDRMLKDLRLAGLPD